MAADSASSFASGMVYRHADKIVNLRQGLPIGVMVTGAGGIGNESIDTLLTGCGKSRSVLFSEQSVPLSVAVTH